MPTSCVNTVSVANGHVVPTSARTGTGAGAKVLCDDGYLINFVKEADAVCTLAKEGKKI